MCTSMGILGVECDIMRSNACDKWGWQWPRQRQLNGSKGSCSGQCIRATVQCARLNVNKAILVCEYMGQVLVYQDCE